MIATQYIGPAGGTVADQDRDGIPDSLDKCSLDSRNAAASCDTDRDGYGNPCDADFNQDGATTSLDYSMYFVPALRKATPSSSGTDMNCDGKVTSADYSMYFAPMLNTAAGGGPSGLACAGTTPCD